MSFFRVSSQYTDGEFGEEDYTASSVSLTKFVPQVVREHQISKFGQKLPSSWAFFANRGQQCLLLKLKLAQKSTPWVIVTNDGSYKGSNTMFRGLRTL